MFNDVTYRGNDQITHIGEPEHVGYMQVIFGSKKKHVNIMTNITHI
jgi:hypothetical protein